MEIRYSSQREKINEIFGKQKRNDIVGHTSGTPFFSLVFFTGTLQKGEINSVSATTISYLLQ